MKSYTEEFRKRQSDLMLGNTNGFKKGHKTNVGRICKESTRLKISLANFKGDDVGYGGLHDWVRKVLGTPKECGLCGTKTAKKFEWANKSKLYKREPSDWIRVCTPCHRKIDFDSVPIGEKNGMTKLTEKQVRIIKHALSFKIRGTIKWLAKMCKVEDCTIQAIKDGRLWKHIIIT